MIPGSVAPPLCIAERPVLSGVEGGPGGEVEKLPAPQLFPVHR